MKTFKKSYLPKEINYNGKILKANFEFNGPTDEIINLLRQQGRTTVKVEVLHKRLSGLNDLHGNVYTPNIFIFSN